MATALHQKFIEKSHAAMLAAIEVYNKPRCLRRHGAGPVNQSPALADAASMPDRS